MGEAFSQPGSRGGAERRPLLSPREPGQGAGRGSFVPCPTCRGSGEIPQEREKQLVALIPYGDQRLEPRRTKLFVFLAVLLCLVTAGFAFFFLFPRSISVHPAGLNSSTVAFDKATIHLNATSVLNISNPNYCPVTVTQLTVQALHVSLLVGQLSESLLLPISPLASDQQNLYLAGDQGPLRGATHPRHLDHLLPGPRGPTQLRGLGVCGLPPGKGAGAPPALMHRGTWGRPPCPPALSLSSHP
ncbi:transmembrane protein 106A isoform X1 [Fukomys damarensis]|uniref:transmembrane protein 106A isoform X1 n=1 Tax=Fukomys damarensis TaxID=885580 RepID=UPI00053FE9BA|nr:transmembrane protein 106A isoform X1 [Fukomys damarensis]XP_010641280.1 transmembrane protein 106A isoform X1 [Fukomys damarensis]